MNTNINEVFLKSVGRHCVTLSGMQTHSQSEREQAVLFSGFVIAVDDLWFYVTAGHVPRTIQSAMAAGAKFDIWRLGDQSARGPYKDMGIPFAFVAEDWIVVEDQDVGLDYAALPLRDLYRQALERGGVIPIRRDAWGDHASEYDQWILVGVPFETVKHDGNSQITAKLVSVALVETTAPEGAESKAANQFYARLIEGSETVVRSVEGMSGGPIFSIKRIDGSLAYKVIGVQSAWYRGNRTIAACPFSLLGLGLEKAIREAQDEIARSAAT
jgi:hypothetical protein